MSGSSASPSAARRLLVVIQVMLIVATLFAPIPAVAVEPDPTPTPSAEPTPTPTPTPEPTPTPTPEPSEEPTPTPTPTPDPSFEPDPTPTPTPEPSPEPTPTPTPEAATEPFIVTFASGVSGATQDDILAVAEAVQTDSIPQLRMRAILLAPSAVTDSLATLRDDARVLRVDTDRIRIAEETPSDPSYGDQWALPQIGWDAARDTYAAAGSAVVAILDTGVDASHPDLDGSIVSGASILEDSTWSSDPNGHGTAMAGIVAAETDNAEGIAGVGYAGVSVMPITVLGADGTGQDSDVIAGVVWAADHGADVILMAFSSGSYSASLQAAVDYAWSSGVVLVAAAGNDGSSAGAFPAGDRGVIGVSNTTQSDTLAAGSNYGASVFLGAPGVGIYTTDAGGGYRYISGTSASAAVVAGAAAELFAMDPSASNGVVVGRLARNADPAGTQEETGNGRVNLAQALADISTDAIQPEGSPPVGGGGPFVGPYVTAATNITTATVVARNATCTTAQSSFASGATVCAHVVVTGVGGGGGAGDFFVLWKNPGGTVVRTTTFTVPGTVPTAFDDTFAPTEIGIWTLSVCKTTGCSGGNLVVFATFTVNPTPPTLTATSPASPANNNSPKIIGSAVAGSTVKLYTNSTCTSAVAATGTAAAFASPGLTVSVADNTTTTFYATATIGLFTSACSTSSITYVEDTTLPTGTITINSNATYTISPSVTLNLNATDTNGIVSYRVAQASDCSAATFVAPFSAVSPYSANVAFSLTGLDGAKTVCVQYKDAAGNISSNFTDFDHPRHDPADGDDRSPGRLGPWHVEHRQHHQRRDPGLRCLVQRVRQRAPCRRLQQPGYGHQLFLLGRRSNWKRLSGHGVVLF